MDFGKRQTSQDVSYMSIGTGSTVTVIDAVTVVISGINNSNDSGNVNTTSGGKNANVVGISVAATQSPLGDMKASTSKVQL